MKVNDLLLTPDARRLYRLLAAPQPDTILAVDCLHPTMPFDVSVSELDDCDIVSEDVLFQMTDFFPRGLDDLSPDMRRVALERYSMIAGVLTALGEPKLRSQLVEKSAAFYQVSKQTIRKYLIRYLIYGEISALVNEEPTKEEVLTIDQKNMRWALNRFFYTPKKDSLKTAFIKLLKEKYTDSEGKLLSEHPSFYQFRYFYRTHRKTENFLISREGLKKYQRDHRPLIGDGIHQFAPILGCAMLDSTLCDIYLVDDAGTGNLVGRPILVCAVDAASSLCLGFALLLEGGVYSLQNLMLNIICDKVDMCEKFGIAIFPDQWPVKDQLPSVLVTDKGSEYISQTFEQITELGVRIVNLPSFRPELKGPIEKLFDLVQGSYKDALKGHGVIMPDFQERGSKDYRKEACLSLHEFERIIVRCIVYYNSERIIENYPYNQAMLKEKVYPTAASIWAWKHQVKEEAFVPTTKNNLIITLLPRTGGEFTRFGLKVHQLRYHANGYKERYLQGGKCTVAYNPDDCSKVWLRECDGTFVEFNLIESRFKGLPIEETKAMKRTQREIVRSAVEDNYQARIELLSFIESTTGLAPIVDSKLKDIRITKSKERAAEHKNIGGMLDE